MLDRPRKSVEIREFPGLISNMDPNDMPPGYGIVQTNVTCVVEAEMDTRAGYRVVSFET